MAQLFGILLTVERQARIVPNRTTLLNGKGLKAFASFCQSLTLKIQRLQNEFTIVMALITVTFTIKWLVSSYVSNRILPLCKLVPLVHNVLTCVMCSF